MEQLTELGFTEITQVKCGVYVLVYNGKVLWVGQSKSGFSRIAFHIHRMKAIKRGKAEHGQQDLNGTYMLFNQIYFYPCKEEELDRVEWEMTSELSPKFARTNGGKWGYTYVKPLGTPPLSKLLSGLKINRTMVDETIRRF